jgi:hypothetical protein
MKRNTEATKTFIVKALAALPQDNCLGEVCGDLKRALYKLERVEQKRAKRETSETAAQQWWSAVSFGVNDPVLRTDVSHQIAKKTLNHLDNLIKSEMDKIEALSNKPKPSKVHDEEDGDEIQTLHG